MRHCLPDGLELHYELHGRADATQAMVFLNGLSQSTAAWAGLVHALGKKYRLVLVDLLFQGQSDEAPEHRSFEEHAADLADLLRNLQLPADTILVGISYGGAVAQRFLVKHPELVQRGVLLSTFPFKDAYFDGISTSWKQALLAGGYPLMLDVMLPFVLGRTYFLNPIITIENLKNSKTSQSPTPDRLLKLVRATEESGNYLEELKKVQVPVLVVHGEEDMLCTPEMGRAMYQSLPHGELEILPHVGHTLNLECIPDLIQLLDAFAAKAIPVER
ncbi:alpha/beta hydrolase [Pontibacter sp. HSC-14F20]|uniref:alpha/beta fold hydrolase n=1 Tax=Pontibacter sp. HSC-14F20 TaxID=2864136 RepID=UPI001C73219E|nr:alpha/beta hydrolase [Pontibacter sp. HSC-14F20]MBX0334394.1 alpha/beta hydrolase [Pontibacter sp. HSC-14F20]